MSKELNALKAVAEASQGEPFKSMLKSVKKYFNKNEKNLKLKKILKLKRPNKLHKLSKNTNLRQRNRKKEFPNGRNKVRSSDLTLKKEREVLLLNNRSSSNSAKSMKENSVKHAAKSSMIKHMTDTESSAQTKQKKPNVDTYSYLTLISSNHILLVQRLIDSKQLANVLDDLRIELTQECLNAPRHLQPTRQEIIRKPLHVRHFPMDASVGLFGPARLPYLRESVEDVVEFGVFVVVVGLGFRLDGLWGGRDWGFVWELLLEVL